MGKPSGVDRDSLGGVQFAGDMQFVSEVAAAAITNTSAIFSFIGDYGLFLGLAWLAYLVFKPD